MWSFIPGRDRLSSSRAQRKREGSEARMPGRLAGKKGEVRSPSCLTGRDYDGCVVPGIAVFAV